MLAAVEAHPVTRAQHRPRRPARHAATGAITVAGCGGTDRSAVSSCRHSRWYSTGSTATGLPAALAPSISGTGAANAAAAPSAASVSQVARVPVPASHRRFAVNRVRGADQPVLPARPAHTPRRVASNAATSRDGRSSTGRQSTTTADPSHAAHEVVRRVRPSLPCLGRPEQPKRLRGDPHHPGRGPPHQVIALQPRLIAHMPPSVADHQRPGRCRCPRYDANRRTGSARLQRQRPRLSQGNPGLLAVPRHVRQLEPINPIGSTTLNRPQHRHSRASCPTKIRVKFIRKTPSRGNLHWNGTFVWKGP